VVLLTRLVLLGVAAFGIAACSSPPATGGMPPVTYTFPCHVVVDDTSHVPDAVREGESIRLELTGQLPPEAVFDRIEVTPAGSMTYEVEALVRHRDGKAAVEVSFDESMRRAWSTWSATHEVAGLTSGAYTLRFNSHLKYMSPGYHLYFQRTVVVSPR
jgi:hypothetical protein